MEVVESHNNQIRKNTFSGNSQGIAMFASTGNFVTGNDVSNNLQDGILLFGANGNKLMRNAAQANTYGIWLDASNDNTIRNNQITENTDTGVIVTGESNSNMIVGNQVGSNENGISLFGITVGGDPIGVPVPADNYLKRNKALVNTTIGIFEGNLDFSDFSFSSFEAVPGDQCHNTWLNNDYDNAIAAADCID